MRRADEFATETGERRRERRQTARSRVRVVLETRDLEGRAENVSQSGILFFSEGDLRVSIEIDEPEGVLRKSGRLVRAQRMRGENIGWAIEFDPS